MIKLRNLLNPYNLRKNIKNTIIAITIIPITIAALILFASNSRTQWNSTVEKVNTLAFKSSESINEALRSTVSFSAAIAQNKYIVNSLNTDLNQDVSLNVELNEILKIYIDHLRTSISLDEPKCIIYHNNTSIFKTKYTDSLTALPADIQQLLADRNTSKYFWRLTENSVSLYRPVLTTTDYTAIVCYTFSMDYFKNIISEFQYAIKDEIIETQTEVRIEDAADAGIFSNQKDNGSYIVQNDLLCDAILTATLDKSVKTDIYVRNFGKVFAILGIFIVLLISAANLTSTFMTKKIDAFINNMKRVKSFKNISEIPIDTDDDFYPIYQNIMDLVEKIDKVHREMNEINFEKTAIELEYMQSKINPHLLYNSLSSLKWYALDIGDTYIADSISMLTQYYHGILSKGRSIVTIREELELTEKYIKVMNFTHSHTYKYTIDVDSDILEFTTVKLILQPFVENSILHGINRNPDGLITISGRLCDGYIILKISDNGCGIDADKLRHIIHLDYDSDYLNYGIKNTIRRINLYYKNDCDFHIESVPSKGTTVTLKIKAFEANDLYERYKFLYS